MRKFVSVLAFGGLVAFCASNAHAVVLSFNHVAEPGDGPSQVADGMIGESQLFVEVTDAGSGQVSFRFYNTGPNASSITDVYFDDGSLLGIASLIDADDGMGGDAGVDFTELASPGELPGANNVSPTFETTAGFSADSDAPAQPNGVNPGEQLWVIFDLQGGQTFADVEDELDSGALRIGIHVQGFDSGGSEAFVNNGVIPAPGAFLLGIMGLGLIGAARRRLA